MQSYLKNLVHWARIIHNFNSKAIYYSFRSITCGSTTFTKDDALRIVNCSLSSNQIMNSDNDTGVCR